MVSQETDISADHELEGLINRTSNTGKSRSISKRVAARGRLPQLHHQIEEVSRRIGFEGDYEFLIIKTKRITGVDLDRWIAMTELNVFVHHPLPRRFGQRIPFARFHER